MSNLTKQQVTAKVALQKSVDKMADEIKKALPNEMDVGRFSRVVMTAVTRTPKLMDCTQTSFFGSLLLAAQLGLEPNGPDQKCFLIPYGQECQFQLGYRGLLELARRSGELSSIHAEVAYENDKLHIELGMNPTVEHTPLLIGDRGDAILAYSVARFKDGSTDFVWMNKADIEKARKANRGKSPAWESWWSEMAKKVVMKRHLKTLPLNAEIQKAVNSDETIKREFVSDMTEEQPDETMEATDEITVATATDKAAFYEKLSADSLSDYVTIEEKSEVNGTITSQRLRDLLDIAILREKEEHGKAKATAKDEKAKSTAGTTKSSGVAGETF